MLQITKYGLTEIKNWHTYILRLTNQLWKLIPMRENGEDWEKQIDSLILELTGTNEILILDNNLCELLSKLEGLRSLEISFELYRKTVFETISLLQKLKEYE